MEQGKHEDSGFDYVALFKYLSDGDPSINMPPRSPLQVAEALNSMSSSGVKKGLKRYLSNIEAKPSVSEEDILETIGKFYRNKTRDVFGDESKLAPKADYTKELSRSPNTPFNRNW